MDIQREPAPQVAASSREAATATPWWRVRMVWLVIGGPLAVVIASFATLTLAISRPDPVLSPQEVAGPAETPAVQARNHAASPQR